MSQETEEKAVERLAWEIESGQWDKKYGHLRYETVFHGALRLVVSN